MFVMIDYVREMTVKYGEYCSFEHLLFSYNDGDDKANGRGSGCGNGGDCDNDAGDGDENGNNGSKVDGTG